MARNPEEQTQFEKDEELRAAQTQYDPTKHGAGTQVQVAPDSVAELHKMVVALKARVKKLESGQGAFGK